MSIKLSYKQVFYSTASAMEVELSKNGIFVSLAPPKFQKNENGNQEYRWQDKSISKLSLNELCHLSEAIKAFRFGIEMYEDGAKNLTAGKYKNYQFVHKSKTKGISYCGFNLYGEKLQYIIRRANDKTKDMYFNIHIMDIVRLEKFFDFIINQAFYFNALETAQNIIDNKSMDDDNDFYEESSYRANSKNVKAKEEVF